MMKAINGVQFQSSWGPSAYDQLLVVEMLKDGSYVQYLSALRCHLEMRNKFSTKILEKHSFTVKECLLEDIEKVVD